MMLSSSSSAAIATSMAGDDMMECVNTNTLTTTNMNASTMASVESIANATFTTILPRIHDTSIDYLSVHPPKRLRRTISPVLLNEDYEWCGIVIKNLFNIIVVNFPVTMYDVQRSPIVSFESDHYQPMTAGWNSACEQERFLNDLSKKTNIVFGRDWRRTITNVVIGREWRRTIFMQAYEFVSTLQIPTSMISLAFAMLDRFNDRDLLILNDLTIAFLACFSFAVETNMSRSIIPMIASDIIMFGTYSVAQLIDMEKRVKQFFLSTEIGFEYGCSPLHANEYSQPIIAERLLYILESHIDHLDVSNLLGVDCSLLLDQAKHVAATCALEEDYICIRPSSIAFASVIVAMDILHFPRHAYEWFSALPVYRHKEETMKITKRMRRIYEDLIHQKYNAFEASI